MTSRMPLRIWYVILVAAIILTLASAILFLIELAKREPQPWGELFTTIVGVLLLIAAVVNVRALRRRTSV